MNGIRSISPPVAALLLLLLTMISYWIFFDTYRANAFDTTPHDDYAPYLLELVGEEGGSVPGAPFAYRVLSVALAVPFYHTLPLITFSRLEQIDASYLRAVEALAMTSYLTILITAVMIFLTVHRRLGGSPAAGVIGALVSLQLFQFTGMLAIDPTGIMLISIALYCSGRVGLFAVLVLLSVGVNEKVSIVLFILFLARALVARERRAIPLALLSLGAFALYLGVRLWLDLPGYERQVQVTGFLSVGLENLANMLTPRRFVLDILPIATLLVLLALAIREWRREPRRYDGRWHPVDGLTLPGLYLVCIVVGINLNIGRVMMFCFPLYLPLAAIAVDSLLLGHGRHAPSKPPSRER